MRAIRLAMLAAGTLGTVWACGRLSPAREKPARPAATRPRPAVPTFGSTQWNPRRPYVVHRATGAVTIDRRPHPEQWKKAMVIRGFRIPKTHRPARSRSEAMMLWDDRNLYVQIVARDADLRGKFKRRTDPLWEEDVVELFLKPRKDRGAYYEFEVNPIGTVMALRIDDRRDGKSLKERSAWETGIVSAVQVAGTVNDPADTDRFYRVILAIPWKRLSHVGGKAPRAGETWTFSFCRYDYARQYKKAEESASAALTTDSFHQYEDYSTLRFAGP